MSAPKNRVFVGERVSRRGIETAAGDIAEAVRACDYDRAATIAFAKGTPSIDEVLAILPGIEMWTIACGLIAIAQGDKTRILELLEKRRYPIGTDSGEVEAIALYAAWKAGAPRERLIPETRRLSVRTMTAEGFALVATVGAALEDANVTAATRHLAKYAKEHAGGVVETDKTLARTLAQTLASLPAEVEIPDGGGFTVRAAKPVGRNEPCPCGSGQKFKKCCADKPTAKKAGSPIAGVSWDEFLTTAADRMTAQHVEDLALVDLVKVDFSRLPWTALAHALARLVAARQWDHAERAMSAAPADRVDDLREQILSSAMECDERERCRRLYEQLGEAYRPAWELDFTDDDAALWRALVRRADEAVKSDDRVAHVELAFSLLRRAPALGIVAARSCIGAAKFDDPDLLLEIVEDVRDRLGYPPGDPAWDVLDTIAVRSAEAEQDSAAAENLKDQLRSSSKKAEAMEKALAEMRQRLDDARAPVSELVREQSPVRGLEDKVAELEALIREGNAERRELRKQLQSTQAADKPGPGARLATPANDVDPDDAIADPVAVAARPIAIPRFDRRATDALRDVPQAVAAEAMRTIGAIAAGDFAAWRQVKQAKDMPKAVLMARVGIHHRLIMSSDGTSLDVLDLVTREQLMTTLKRLRANL